jgi:hypothetical protein
MAMRWAAIGGSLIGLVLLFLSTREPAQEEGILLLIGAGVVCGVVARMVSLLSSGAGKT